MKFAGLRGTKGRCDMSFAGLRIFICPQPHVQGLALPINALPCATACYSCATMNPHCHVCFDPFPPYPVSSHAPLALPCGKVFVIKSSADTYRRLAGHVVCRSCFNSQVPETETPGCPFRCVFAPKDPIVPLAFEFEFKPLPPLLVPAVQK